MYGKACLKKTSCFITIKANWRRFTKPHGCPLELKKMKLELSPGPVWGQTPRKDQSPNEFYLIQTT